MKKLWIGVLTVVAMGATDAFSEENHNELRIGVEVSELHSDGIQTGFGSFVSPLVFAYTEAFPHPRYPIAVGLGYRQRGAAQPTVGAHQSALVVRRNHYGAIGAIGEARVLSWLTMEAGVSANLRLWSSVDDQGLTLYEPHGALTLSYRDVVAVGSLGISVRSGYLSVQGNYSRDITPTAESEVTGATYAAESFSLVMGIGF